MTYSFMNKLPYYVEIYFMFSIYLLILIFILSIPTSIGLLIYYFIQKNECDNVNNDPKSDYCMKVDEKSKLVNSLKIISSMAGFTIFSTVLYVGGKYLDKF